MKEYDNRGIEIYKLCDKCFKTKDINKFQAPAIIRNVEIEKECEFCNPDSIIN